MPEVIKRLADEGKQRVIVERGAGEGALIPDEAFAEAGAQLVDDAGPALDAGVVVKVARAESIRDRRIWARTPC